MKVRLEAQAARSLALLVCAGIAGGAALGALAPACSLAQGQGSVKGTLDVPNCWVGAFDLEPDFFAGVPYRQSLQLRIQRGGDYEAFSDGLSILVDDIGKIRPSDDGIFPGLYDTPLPISLPVGVSPPGVPLVADPSPAPVHLVLYLQQSCRTLSTSLYAVEQATLPCMPPDGGSDPPLTCALTADASAPGPDGGSAPDGGAPTTGRSTITFHSLFDGKPDEEVAAKRRSTGSFHVYLADPREVCPGGLGPAPRCRGELTGDFDFYFQRGRPAQPFP